MHPNHRKKYVLESKKLDFMHSLSIAICHFVIFSSLHMYFIVLITLSLFRINWTLYLSPFENLDWMKQKKTVFTI